MILTLFLNLLWPLGKTSFSFRFLTVLLNLCQRGCAHAPVWAQRCYLPPNRRTPWPSFEKSVLAVERLPMWYDPVKQARLPGIKEWNRLAMETAWLLSCERGCEVFIERGQKWPLHFKTFLIRDKGAVNVEVEWLKLCVCVLCVLFELQRWTEAQKNLLNGKRRPPG